MYSQLFISTVLLHFVIAVDLDVSKYDDENDRSKALVTKNNGITHKNAMYIEKSENMIRLPAVQQADKKNQSKKQKKSPKTVIQKIIKKNRQRTKKIYVKLTTPSVKTADDFDMDKDESQWKEIEPTSPPNQRKRAKKYKPKFARYPMPFKNMKNKRRERRNVGTDFYILKNFNELKFIGDPLDKNKDYIVANTHVKNYW